MVSLQTLEGYFPQEVVISLGPKACTDTEIANLKKNKVEIVLPSK